MPRVFSTDPHYNSSQGHVDFVNGAAALPASATGAIAYFTAEGFTIDTSKNALTPYDTLTLAQIRAICDFLGCAYLVGDTKAQVIRKLETSLSAKYIGALTVASIAGTASGDTNITVTEALTGTNVHKYKTHATTAPAILYGDHVDATWLALTSGADITATTGHKIAVVECDPVTGFVYKRGTANITSKA